MGSNAKHVHMKHSETVVRQETLSQVIVQCEELLQEKKAFPPHLYSVVLDLSSVKLLTREAIVHLKKELAQFSKLVHECEERGLWVSILALAPVARELEEHCPEFKLPILQVSAQQ
jgi:hypothetical protein